MSTTDFWQVVGQVVVALIGAAGIVMAAWVAATYRRRKRSR